MVDVNIGLYNTNHVFKFDTYAAPLSEIKELETRGNALISSVYIKSMDPGVTGVNVKYSQTTAGTTQLGEDAPLDSHKTFTAADVGLTETIVVTRIHHKPNCELEILGTGNVELGVYVTVTNEVASDIDSALIEDGDTFIQTSSKAIPMACYDEDNGQLWFVRCKDGALSVAVDPGTGVYREGQETSVNNAGNTHTFDTFSVPVGKIYRMEQVIVSTNVDGVFTLKAGGAIIAKGRTGPSSVNSKFSFSPIRPISAGTSVVLEFDQSYQSKTDSCVDWHIQMSEIDE